MDIMLLGTLLITLMILMGQPITFLGVLVTVLGSWSFVCFMAALFCWEDRHFLRIWGLFLISPVLYLIHRH